MVKKFLNVCIVFTFLLILVVPTSNHVFADSIPSYVPDFYASTITEDSIVLKWSPVTDATSYVVEDGSGNVIYTGSNLTCEATGLLSDNAYTYFIYAKNDYGSGERMSISIITLKVPSTELSVIKQTENSITLHIDLADYASVDELTISQDGVAIYSPPAFPTTFDYTVNNLSPGVSYEFGLDGLDPMSGTRFDYTATGTTTTSTPTIYDDQNQPPYDLTAAPPDGLEPSYNILDQDLISTQTGICQSSGGVSAYSLTTTSITSPISNSLSTTDLNYLATNPDAYSCPSGVGSNTISYSSTPKLNELISVTSYKRNSDGSITVSYKIKKSYSTSEYIQIGYEWPPEYRDALSPDFKTASRSYGTHTITISKPYAFVGRLILKLKYGAGGGRYTERKTFGNVFHSPSGKKVTYHTVTRAEVAGDSFIYYAVPGVFFQFIPGSKVIKITGTLYLGWNLWDNFSTRTTLSTSFPHPVQGQYYRITNWYSDYKLNTQVEVWSSKEAYTKGVAPSAYLTFYTF